MKPTYGTYELISLILQVDMDTLFLIGWLVVEERERYSNEEREEIMRHMDIAFKIQKMYPNEN